MNKTDLEIIHKFSIGEIVYPIFYCECDCVCKKCGMPSPTFIWEEECPVAIEGIAFSYFPDGAELDGYILANHPADVFNEDELFRTEEEAKAECNKRNEGQLQ